MSIKTDWRPLNDWQKQRASALRKRQRHAGLACVALLIAAGALHKLVEVLWP